jgi:hypothetical protein
MDGLLESFTAKLGPALELDKGTGDAEEARWGAYAILYFLTNDLFLLGVRPEDEGTPPRDELLDLGDRLDLALKQALTLPNCGHQPKDHLAEPKDTSEYDLDEGWT